MTTAQVKAREYLRVSKDRSGRRRSVTEQHRDHQGDATEHGWVLGEPYADNDVGASRYTRKSRGEWAELVADLEAGAFAAQVLILWESSRGSRRVGEWVELLDLCERHRVRIWVHTHQTLYDPANPRHRRTLLEDAVDSEYEVSKSRERIMRGVRANAKDGKPHGKLLYGHRRVYDDRGNYVRTEKHPERAAIVLELAERVDAGEPDRRIAADLNERGVPPPRPGRGGKGPLAGQWRPEQVARTVMNPGYAGLRSYQGKIVGKADWPVIIPEDLWRRCVARHSGRTGLRDGTVRHLLSGAIVCGVCGLPLRVLKQTPRGRPRPDGSRRLYEPYRSYLCHPAGHVAIRQDWLDEYVTELVLQRMERPDALDLLTPPDTGSAADKAARELAELEQDLNEFYALARARKLSARGLAEVEADRLPRIEQLRRLAEPTGSAPAAVRLLASSGRPRQIWASEDFTVEMQRASVIWTLELKLMPASRPGARGFDPARIDKAWRGA